MTAVYDAKNEAIVKAFIKKKQKILAEMTPVHIFK